MRVGFDIAPLLQTRAGTARWVGGLRRGLEARDDIDVVPLSWGGAGDLTAVARDVLWYPALLPLAAARARVDVLHCTIFRAPPRARVPTIVTVHDLAVLRHPNVFPAWTRLYGPTALRPALRAVDRVFAVSEFSKREAVELAGVDPDRVDVVPNALEPVFHADGPAARGRLRAGGRDAGTAQEPRARDRGRTAAGVELRLVGAPGWGDAGVDGDHVTWLGRVGDDELAAAYGAHAVVVFPSLYEGFGIPALEAMACGHAGRDEPRQRDGGGHGRGGGARRSARLAAIAEGIEEADRRRAELVPLGLERAKLYRLGTRRRRRRRGLREGARVSGAARRRRCGRARPPPHRRRDVRAQPPARARAARARRGVAHRSGDAPPRARAEGIEQCARHVDPGAAHDRHPAAPAPQARRRSRALPVRAPARRVMPGSRHDSRSLLRARAEPDGRKDRSIFKAVVPRAAAQGQARPDRLRADASRPASSSTAIPDEKIVVTPNGVDPVFTPGNGIRGQDYVLFVGAVQERKNPLAALAAAESAGLPLVIAGPAKDAALARELERRGARIAGYVAEDELVELYRGAACLVQPSRYEGFGLPVLEAMACGTPVVAVPEPALQEVAGDAAVWADEDELADGIRRAVADRDRLVAAGLERARLFSGPRPPGARSMSTARCSGEGLGDRRLARPRGRARSGRCPRSPPRSTSSSSIANLPGSVGAVPRGCPRPRERAPRSFAANVNVGIAETSGEYVVVSNPDAVSGTGGGRALVRFADAHPRAGLVGPLVSGRTGPGSRRLRRFPTVLGTIWRRTPLRLLRRPYDHQVSHYGTRPAGPVQGDWLLGGACLLMRRRDAGASSAAGTGLPPLRRGHRRRLPAAQAGWERWLVPEAVVRHDYAAVIDKRFLTRHTLWHLRGMLRFVRKHPERLLVAALSA